MSSDVEEPTNDDQGEEPKMKVIWSINYKNIIEIHEYSQSTNKYALGTSNTLEIRYVKNYQQFHNYIIAKWKALEPPETYGGKQSG